MTTWTTISDAVLAQDKPLTQSVVRALRDNVSALAEGSSGAPAIVYAAMDSFMETAGGVGSIVQAATTGSLTVSFGATTAGSNLTPCAAGGVTSPSGTLSGTWYNLGYVQSGGTFGNRVSNYIRIS